MSQSMMDSRVISAARSGNIAQLRELYDEDPNLLNSSSTPYGNTALHFAVIFRQEELAKELCSKCPSLLSASNADGNTPLLLAAAAGLQPIVAFAISPASRLGDVEEGKQMLMATNKTGNNALHEALRNGHSEVALELVRAEPELAQKVNNNKESPLYMACYRGLEEVVKELLKSPAATHGGPNGDTAIHAVVTAGHLGLVEAMLKEKPDLVKEKNRVNGDTPLHYASSWNKLAVVKLLLDSDASSAYVVNNDGVPPIFWAVGRGHLPIVKEFVRCCPDSALMTSTKGYGNTLLHDAVGKERVEVVKYILRTPELQRLINQPNNVGDTPLHVAVQRGNTMILQELLARKSLDKAAANIAGRTAVDVLFLHYPKWTPRWGKYLFDVEECIPGPSTFRQVENR